MKPWRLATLLLLLAMALAVARPALAQCSMCQSVLTQSPEGRRMSEQLNNAILVLFLAPYLVCGSVAAVLFRARLARTLGRVARMLFLSR
jgi:hypothetical protein